MAPWIFLMEVAGLSSAVCLIHSARSRLGLVPVYLLVGLFEAFLFVVGKPKLPINAELFFIEPRGIYLIFLATIMVAGVLIYVLEGTSEARRFLAGLAILYLAHGAIDIFIEYHASHPPPGELNQGGIDLVWYSTHARIASMGAILADFVVIIVIYQALHNRFPKVPLAFPLYLALIAAMITDAAVFKLIRHGDLAWSVFNIGAKAQAGAAAGIPAALYFAWQLRRTPDAAQKGILNRNALELVDMRRKLVVMREKLAEKQAEYIYIKENFSQYVSAEVVDAILLDPSKLKLGGELREVTILFADIRGYSTLSESMEPTEVVRILNQYFGLVGAVILANKGMINEFEGDAVLAVFGAPLDLPNHADAALKSAVEMLQRVEQLNEVWRQDGTLERWREVGIGGLAIRIGIHSGPVVAGNIGSEERKKYAVIGDTVNITSRVEGLNKELETSLLVTQATRERVAGNGLGGHLRDCGEHAVKGRSERVRVYAWQAATVDASSV
ncbi:MAG: hypothetical protein CO108_18525 [Deltaproteobacteria bacterium CG_4_9_14_3_um_filter_63_12]|nr:MAG: hypothetical protein CO108_18525 [Deltaproteobacteria bacterium CG_4_9_14_3_um_filter_63_12]